MLINGVKKADSHMEGGMMKGGMMRVVVGSKLGWSITLLLGLIVGITGCSPYAIPMPAASVQKTAVVLSMNEERDMVTMGANYVFLEKPVVDWQQARSAAVEHCIEWRGMPNAEPVGPTRRECLAYSGSDCVRWAIMGDYQCHR